VVLDYEDALCLHVTKVLPRLTTRNVSPAKNGLPLKSRHFLRSELSEESEVVSTKVLTIPNLISFARLALVPLFFWLFVTRANDVASFSILAVIGSTDWVDGFVARKTHQVSVLGKLIDPIADRIAVVVVLLALLFRGTIPLLLAAVILVRDLLVAIIFPILEARGYPRIAVNIVGKAATAAIYCGVGLATMSLIIEPSDQIHSVGIVLLWAGATLYWIAGAMYVLEIRRLLRIRAA
jgi:cardiolipin synthase